MRIAAHNHTAVQDAHLARERSLDRLQRVSLLHPDSALLVQRIRAIGIREAQRRALKARVAYREARAALSSAEQRDRRWTRAYHRVRK